MWSLRLFARGAPAPRAPRSAGANVFAARVLCVKCREDAPWLQDDTRYHEGDRLLSRVLRTGVVLFLNRFDHVLEREVACEHDTAAADELVERRVVEHRRHFVPR